jgi:hypothetical protein
MPDSKGPPKNIKDPKKSVASDNLEMARKKIRDRIQLAEEAKRLDLQRRRLMLAGKGSSAYSEKHLAEAAQAFRGYIKIMEDFKGMPQGGLSPAHFDHKTELPELMLVSGVYWDLVKLYDRTRSQERYSEFKEYLGKYILFSKGLPYQTMCSESLRKYCRSNKAVHKKDFNDAYKQIAVSKCFIVTELDEYIADGTLESLRDFRDEVLLSTPLGKSFVSWYYKRGPGFASFVGGFPETTKRVLGTGLDLVAGVAAGISARNAR